MQCNIDAKGKALRLVVGGLSLVGAGVVAALILTGTLAHPAWWSAVVGGGLGGAFGVFEGWSGWCAVRAMGFKTPI